MAKRRTRAEIREEFVRLLKVHAFFQDQRLLSAREHGAEEAKLIEDFWDERGFERALEDFDARRPWSFPAHPPDDTGVRWTASMHLQGLREALNDELQCIQMAIADEPIAGPTPFSQLPDIYKRQTGSDLFEDSGDPAGRAKAIVKQGKISDEEEWRILNGLLSDVEQTILTPKQTETAERLLGEFESQLSNK